MRVTVFSDIHFAGPEERQRHGFEIRAIGNPALRLMAHVWRDWFWLRDPLGAHDCLGRLIAASPDPELLVANGDFTVDTAFVGVSDDAALASASEALSTLRTAYGSRLLATIGDHELGKTSLFGGAGGLRLESWRRCADRLGLEAVWRRDLGPWSLIGIASTPVAFPVFEPESPPEERPAWQAIRKDLLDRLEQSLDDLGPDRRWLLFVHDPSALPFLRQVPAVTRRLPQLALTVVGHLHTPAIFGLAERLAGMPRIGFLGTTVRRNSTALREARVWKEFRTVLCPSPTGIQLLKDGGWLELQLDPEGRNPVQIRRRRLPWRETAAPFPAE